MTSTTTLQPELNEPVTKTGPCGISCTVCRFYIDERCQCRIGENSSPHDKAGPGLCPEEQCAVTRNIAFCARDCVDFPCLLLERTIPYYWSRLSIRNSDAPLPGREPSGHAQIAANQENASQDSKTLRVFCLGQFRVFRGTVELEHEDWGNGKGPTQKIKALFAFLLVRRAQGARKETLMDLFWPQQSDPRRASSSFHQALFHLRRALEPDLKARAASSYVRRRGERYFFDPQLPYWVDADAFVHCANRAQALERGGDPDAAIAYWSTAIDLYGGKFMAGIDTKYTDSEYYDWCAPRCRQVRQLYLAASMTVARRRFDLGQYSLALEQARQTLAVEPASEPAHRLAMRCLLKIGHLDSASAQYRICEAELAWHEDRAPSRQTQTLYQRLLENLQHLTET